MKFWRVHLNPCNVGSCNFPFILSRCGVYGPSHYGFVTGEVSIKSGALWQLDRTVWRVMSVQPAGKITWITMMYSNILLTHALKTSLLTSGGRSVSILSTDHPPSPLSTRRGILDINSHSWYDLQIASHKSTWLDPDYSTSMQYIVDRHYSW